MPAPNGENYVHAKTILLWIGSAIGLCVLVSFTLTQVFYSNSNDKIERAIVEQNRIRTELKQVIDVVQTEQRALRNSQGALRLEIKGDILE